MDTKKVLSQMTLEEKASMCSGLDFWHLKGVERLGIPSIMVSDGPHGLRKQEDNASADMLGVNQSITAICFPTASALAASFDRNLLKEVGETLGKECQAVNLAVLLGPGNNIKRSPLCGRNFEYFSEDPYLASELAAAHIQGVQSQGIGTSMKHFAANNQETKRMLSDSVIDERTLHEIYLAAFEGAVKQANPKTIMCSYNKVNGTYLSENKELLTDILRDKWGFKGVVMTDWGAGKDRVKGIDAGLNLEMPGSNGATDIKIVEAVRNGTLEEAKLDQLVLELLEVIDWHLSHRQEGLVFDYEGDHQKAIAVATECAVLLKNENHILPLRKGQKIAMIGDFVTKPRYQGSGSSHINSWRVDNIADILAGESNISFVQGYSAKQNGPDGEMLREAVAEAAQSEIAVIFAGLPDSFESEGFDRKHMRIPQNQIDLIHEVAKVQPNVVVVLNNGAPVEMPWLHEVKAVLEMYLAGEGVGSAEAKLLFGEANPSGKLAETFPLKLEDNPSYLNFPGIRERVEYREGIYVGYRYYDKKKMDVLFPFGFGLSYTTFEYSDMYLSTSSMKDQDKLTVTCKVKNTGCVEGKEVVQLYVGPADENTRTIPMASKALKGFEKVSLKPGEEQTVEFLLDNRAFAYYDELIHDWNVESGDFVICIGASSRDIRLTQSVHVESSREIPLVFTKYSAMGDIMRSKVGQAILGQMKPTSTPIQVENTNKNAGGLGEGSQEMMAAMAQEMPLAALVNFGIMTEEQMDQFVIALNK